MRACDAKKLIRAIVASGSVLPTSHFNEEAGKDTLSIVDAENVLRGGVVREAEFENGAWRYCVETPRIRVVVEFESEEELILITIMRLR